MAKEKTEKKTDAPAAEEPKAVAPIKPSGVITRKFYLDSEEGEVEVTVKGPRRAVRLASSETHLYVVTGDAELPDHSRYQHDLDRAPGFVTGNATTVPASNRTLDAAGEQKFRELQKSERERVEAEKKKKNPNAQIWDDILGEEGAGKSIMNHLENHGAPTDA